MLALQQERSGAAMNAGRGSRKDPRKGRAAPKPNLETDLLLRIRELQSRVTELEASNEHLRERKSKTRILASARQLQATLDAIRDGICLLDWHGKIIRCNATYQAFIGRPTEEITGRFYTEVMRLVPAVVEAAPVEKAWHLRARVGIDVALNDRWYHVSVDPLLDDKGETGGAVCVIRDITLRKDAEQALRESERRLRLAASQVPAILWTTDSQLRFTSSNGAGLAALGHRPDQFVGVDLFEYFRTTDRDFPAIAAHRRALVGESVTYDLEWGGRAFHSRVEPLRDDEGTIIGTSGVAQDVTDHVRMEQALAASEERLRRVFDFAPIGISLVAEDRRFLAVNSALCRMLGYSQEDLLRKTFLDVTHPEDLKPSLALELRGRERSGEPITLEKRYLRKGGEVIWVRLTVRAVLDEGGRFLHWLSMTEDITERKLLEEQLRLSQKLEAVGQLAGTVAHDFNNMLAAIKGYTDLVLRGRESDERLVADMGEVRQVLFKAAELTRQLLAIGRPQTLAPRSIDLGRLLDASSGMLGRLVGDQVTLVIASDPGLHLVKADPGQIEQVVMNLALNARDAMPSGGEMRIEARNVDLDEAYVARHLGVRPGPHVLLSVSDAGIGMDAETQAHLFEPFFTTKRDGTGLGLLAVYGVVRQIDGHVAVESVPGKGTTFRIYVPAAV